MQRLNKPFNPILGETFELFNANYKYIAEQVSHHPPVSACHAISDAYTYHMDTETRMQFKGTYLEAIPIGS